MKFCKLVIISALFSTPVMAVEPVSSTAGALALSSGAVAALSVAAVVASVAVVAAGGSGANSNRDPAASGTTGTK